MEQLTTYRAKGKSIGLVFLFKYNLNGNLKLFEIEEGELDEKQINWLYRGYLPKDIKDELPFTTLKELNQHLMVRFPANEAMFKFLWLNNKDMLEKFEISDSPADLSFDALWNLYDHKVSRKESEANFNKLKQGEKIKCFIEVPYYLETLKKNPGIGKLHLSTYISKRRFEDERPQSGLKVGKVFNNVLQDLAKKKTDK